MFLYLKDTEHLYSLFLSVKAAEEADGQEMSLNSRISDWCPSAPYGRPASGTDLQSYQNWESLSEEVTCHSLKTHGATSCLNSVLQVLFKTKEFREAVERFVDKNPKSKLIDPSLNKLFDDLLTNPADAHKIRKTLGIDKATEEKDAAMCLEEILKLTNPDAAQIFYGQMAQRITCSECKTANDSDESFWHLPLELVDSCSGNYSVEDGIKKFFSACTGETQASCELCAAIVDFTRENFIKQHPDVLVLQLKRFDSKSGLTPLIKVNCAVSAPYILETPGNQIYELYAVVDHFGGLKNGYYVAVIKSQGREERWISFDDFTFSSLCRRPLADNKNVARLRNAYLLFYKKVAAETQEKTEVCTNKADEATPQEHHVTNGESEHNEAKMIDG